MSRCRFIVAVVAKVGPFEALKLAATQPKTYADLIQSVHVQIAAFGGSFLMMVGLSYFFDEKKDSHWLGGIERAMARLGRLEAGALGLTLYALNDRGAASELLAAGRYGLAFLAGLWLIHGLFSVKRLIAAPTTPAAPTPPPPEAPVPVAAPVPGGP